MPSSPDRFVRTTGGSSGGASGPVALRDGTVEGQLAEVDAQGRLHVFLAGLAPFMVREYLVGDIDGVNVDFTTTQPFVTGATQVYLNGLLQQEPGDYNEMSSTEIRF